MAIEAPVLAGRIQIRCTACNSMFRVLQSLRTRNVRCPRCGGVFRAAEVAAATPAAPAPPPVVVPEVKADPLLGTTIGNFRILSVLGKGGMGTVYEANDIVLDRRVAVKMLQHPPGTQKKEAIESFLREARAAARLTHPNIVTIYQVGAAGDSVFIAMEVVRGGSAADFLDEHGPMTAQDATRVVRECAAALAEAHSAGLIHRDIKPDNIMLGPAWMVKLTDFGLAKRLEDPNLDPKGKALGTPAYMAPEIIRGMAVDSRADLYSLGATYFTLMTGRQMFRAPDIRTVLLKQVYEDPPDPRRERPGVPDACYHAMMRALAKERDQRYQTAAEFIRDLDSIDFTGAAVSPEAAGEMQNWAEMAAVSQQELSVAASLEFPLPMLVHAEPASMTGAPALSPTPHDAMSDSTDSWPPLRANSTRRLRRPTKGGSSSIWIWVVIAGVIAVVSILLLGRTACAPPADPPATKPAAKPKDR